ncbi:hypothetical protein HBHAL_1652 [Halobacillus halophilus DSM 2266]|uniref:Uncharacterized protein n=1 Tax=Halobacillus halophilus (strain ATCC 35676 / DSM 2266 / JCM 20832 / KCTC 3685 / LMG 17431 / NBRC 102448 / NCIMB 2269) TaxID=866895 RepID=I0JIQ1_HALH3|nr:hypothetical protein [Halobacillus halophilus]CCG44019.1 hypothetical protein HBHAL_1652 [Halobacillus halophilus DSM 2266]
MEPMVKQLLAWSDELKQYNVESGVDDVITSMIKYIYGQQKKIMDLEKNLELENEIKH